MKRLLLPLTLAILTTSCTVSESTATAIALDVPPEVIEAVPERALTALREAPTLELLSLYPYDEDLEGETWKERGYAELDDVDGYAVLGSTSLADSAKHDVLTAFFRGIADSNDDVADCFYPRHALRARHEGHEFAFLICFECLSMSVLEDGQRAGRVLTTQSPREAFNAALTAAKVELSKD